MIGNILKWTLLILSACVLAAALLSYQYLKRPILFPNNRPVIYNLEPKTSILDVAFQLKDLGVIQQPYAFAAYAWLRGENRQLKTGEYQFEPGDTPKSVLHRMSAGRFFMHRLLIVEGWTVEQMLRTIDKDSSIKHTLLCGTPLCVSTKLNIGYLQPEGEFFPDTYLFTKGTPDRVLLMKAYDLMQTRLNRAWATRADNLPYNTPYDALIIASIVEKESQDSEERAMIAGVLVKRLKMHMMLQVDPTVSYGLSHRGENIKLTKGHLRTKSPYNTYLNYGLPPTPICLPGLTSIQAAMHPVITDALYYVAKGGGKTCFSATYKEQCLAIKKYLHKR